jgi:hypothetical protein
MSRDVCLMWSLLIKKSLSSRKFCHPAVFLKSQHRKIHSPENLLDYTAPPSRSGQVWTLKGGFSTKIFGTKGISSHSLVAGDREEITQPFSILGIWTPAGCIVPYPPVPASAFKSNKSINTYQCPFKEYCKFIESRSKPDMATIDILGDR